MYGLAALLGRSSLLVFALFLFLGPFHLVDLEMTEVQKLWFDTSLCLAFFVQHSTMIRESFRKRLVRIIPEAYSGAFYAIVSGVVLLLVLVLWQESTYSLDIRNIELRWLFRLLYFLAIVGFFWGVRALEFFDPFGLKTILAHLRGEPLVPQALSARGPYRWVRHPLYLFVLLMVWSCPDLTADRLLFNVLCTIWIIVGTLLEERDLLVYYGDEYRNYRKEVPMLIPWRMGARR